MTLARTMGTLALGLLLLTGCTAPAGLTGDTLPAEVELPPEKQGGQVEFAAELDGVEYYVIDGGHDDMCIVIYGGAGDWSTACGGPSMQLSSGGQTIAWFPDSGSSEIWEELGGGLWLKS